ncbi:hypothetical protein [Bacillus ndiopicus]|uniref:hypothetical protein n=1 Tax=Bacillus ndiopicus TaxID=1347368 RepID=UPI0005AA94E5|nr:hypothetical protein [Bacillus ndiopicus]
MVRVLFGVDFLKKLKMQLIPVTIGSHSTGIAPTNYFWRGAENKLAKAVPAESIPATEINKFLGFICKIKVNTPNILF